MAMQAVTEPEAPTPGVSDATPLGPDADAKGAAAVEAFARGHEGLTDDDERDALDFLLAPKPPRLYGVKVDYDTEAGMRPLVFVIRGMDGRKIDAIEQANVSEVTGKLDAITAACQLVAEGTVYMEARPGHKVELTANEFLTVQRPGEDPIRLAGAADALEARFKTQLGLVQGVANQLRRISGYDPNRVGAAQRRLADAVGNS